MKSAANSNKLQKVKNPIKAIQYPKIEPPKGLSSETRIIFVGTGSSSTSPHFFCSTDHKARTEPLGTHHYQYGCGACNGQSEYASHNRRANTGIIVRKKGKADEMKTLVFDVGKAWKDNAILLFQAYGLGTIDAAFISHEHDDAASVGWLRDFTESVRGDKLLGPVGVESRLPIQQKLNMYSTQHTIDQLREGTSYIRTDKWKTLEEGKVTSIEGIDIRPIDVLHRVKNRPEIKNLKEAPSVPVKPGKDQVWFTSYLVGNDVLYMSDVAGIPEDKVDLLTNLSPKVLIIDCFDLNLETPHPAHFNLVEALVWAKKIKPGRTYLTGIHHNTAYQTYKWLLDVEASDEPAQAREDLIRHNSDFDEKNIGYIANLKKVKQKAREIMTDEEGKAVMIVKPAYDGLCIVVGDDGKVYDDDD